MNIFDNLFILIIGFAIGVVFQTYVDYKRFKRRKSYSRMSVDGVRYSGKNEVGVKNDSIVAQIQHLYDKGGKVVVDFIDEEEVHLTTLETLEAEHLDNKLNDIKNLIKDNI